MADSKVQAAIDNWAPRFIAQGIDHNDYFRTTAKIERWDEWCREWCATGDLHQSLAAAAELNGNTITAGEANIAAALCYHFAKFSFQDHPDEYREAARKSVDAYARGVRQLDPKAERVEISFEDTTLVGILRRPQGASRPPLALLLPGLDSVKEEFFYWEEPFLKRGLATFSLDGPGQGESSAHTQIRPDYEAAVAVALDVLERRSDLDPKRVGVAGVSMGGYYAVRALAFEPRVRAAVENCGPWNMGECLPAMPELSRTTFQYHSGARDMRDAVAKAQRLTLDGAAQRITHPLLIIHGGLDRLIPLEQAHKIASAAGASAQVVVFENGSHVCNNIPYLYRPLTADWLREKLAG